MHRGDFKETSRNFAIIGASSDIALALSERLKAMKAIQGFRVLLVARDKDKKVADPQRLDWKLMREKNMLNEEHLVELGTVAQEFFGAPFTVIHCVGDFWKHRPLVDLPISAVRQMMDSHYLTFCGVARVLLPIMMRSGGGRFVAFSCNSVVFNYPDMLPFTAAKAAVECAVKCIGHEYAPFGISALALALPTIGTDKVIQNKGYDPSYMTPDELAEIILEQVVQMPVFVNGSVIKVFKPNPTFYKTSYFDRNRRDSGSFLGEPGEEAKWESISCSPATLRSLPGVATG